MRRDDSAVPEWLSRTLQDRSAGPRIYRWTTDDVAQSKKSNSQDSPTMPDSMGAPAGQLATKPTGTRPANDSRQRIYIIGIGNLGRLFAASLARLRDRPPITLVVHRPGLLDQWRAKPGLVLHPRSYLERDNGISTEEDGSRIIDFDVEMWSESPPPGDGAGDSSTDRRHSEIGPISNLIIATKSQDALPTADRLRRYLGSDSVVAFAQNGMNKLWPPYGAIYNAARYGGRRPTGPQSTSTPAPLNPLWLACIVTHGVFSLGPFESVHASPADVVLGTVSGNDSLASLGSSSDGQGGPFLVQQLLAASQLNARCVPRPQLWVLQLEKLVVNSVINPLTAILRCKNGSLFDSSFGDSSTALAKIIDQLLREASTVLNALAAHETGSGGILACDGDQAASNEPTTTSSTASHNQALIARLSFENLRSMLYRVGDVVKDNTSSMLQDVIAGKSTEVKDFNGWIVEMAHYLESIGAVDGHIDVTGHRTLVDLVEAGEPLSREQLFDNFSDTKEGK